MEGGRRAGGESDGDEFEGVGAGASLHADQHGQSGVDVQESRTMEGGRSYRNQGRWKEAEELEVKVMETSLRVMGQEHPSTLTSMANLASTFWNQGRWKEAEELEVQVMETSLRVLGQEHPDTLTSMHNLAFTWRSQRLENKASALMEECFE